MTPDADVGAVIADRYALREALAEAPAYTSFRAFDQDAEVDVEFWWMRPELFPEQARRDRFLGASVELRSLSHPHLRKVFDAGLVGDRGLYVTTQLGTHDGLLPEPGRGRLGPTDLLHYVASVASALEAAHDIGYVHGRLVPSDIVHVSGLIKLGGVGLWADAEPTVARRCWGELERYIAPEVVARGAVTPAADVYSLARICGELAAGSRGANIAAELMASDPPLAQALSAALSVAPYERPQSAGALLDILRAVLVDDRVPTGERHAAPPKIRIPTGGVDSGTPIDSGRYAEEDDPTRHIGRAPSIAGFPDDPIAPPPGMRPGRVLGKALSQARSGFDDDAATVADSGMPKHMPPPAVPRRRTNKPTRPGGSNQSSPSLERPAGLGGVAPALPALPAAPAAPGGVKTTIDGTPPVLPGMGAPRPLPRAASAPTRVDAKPPIMPVSMKERTRTAPPLAAPESGPIRFVSMKERDQAATKTPRVPIVDRPEMKPKLRSLSTVQRPDSVPHRPLGNYAPSQVAHAKRPSGARATPRWLWGLVGVAIVLVVVAVVLVVARVSGGSEVETPDAAPRAAAPATTPVAVVTSSIDAGVVGPCLAGMVLVEAQNVCIDEYESPGKRRLPEVGLSAAQAAAKCRVRGARLCTSVEWEAGCRGVGNASWPYGNAYVPGTCNASRRKARPITTTGSFPSCRSAVGAYDMSGNVAEWIAGGVVRGGSAANRSDGRCSARQRRRTGDRGYSDVGFRCCSAPHAR